MLHRTILLSALGFLPTTYASHLTFTTSLDQETTRSLHSPATLPEDHFSLENITVPYSSPTTSVNPDPLRIITESLWNETGNLEIIPLISWNRNALSERKLVLFFPPFILPFPPQPHESGVWRGFCLVLRSAAPVNNGSSPSTSLASICPSSELSSACRGFLATDPSCYHTRRSSAVAWTHWKFQDSAPAPSRATANAPLHGLDSLCVIFQPKLTLKVSELQCQPFCLPLPAAYAIPCARVLSQLP